VCKNDSHELAELKQQKSKRLLLLRSTVTLWQCAAKIILAFLIFAGLVLQVHDCRLYTPVMYNVSIWSSCVWSRRRGDVGRQCFVDNASRHVCARARAGSSQSDVISRRRRTCLNLSVSTCFFSRLAGGYSRWISDLFVVRVWDVQG